MHWCKWLESAHEAHVASEVAFPTSYLERWEALGASGALFSPLYVVFLAVETPQDSLTSLSKQLYHLEPLDRS